MKKTANELKKGDVLKTWFGDHMISKIEDYKHPTLGMMKQVQFSTHKTGMTIELHLLYETIGC